MKYLILSIALLMLATSPLSAETISRISRHRLTGPYHHRQARPGNRQNAVREGAVNLALDTIDRA